MNSEKESGQDTPRKPWNTPRLKKIEPDTLEAKDPRSAAIERLREKVRPIHLLPFLALLCVPGCAPRAQISAAQIRNIYVACHAKQNVAANHRAAVERCAHPQLEALYAGAPDFDRMEMFWATKLSVAERLDAGTITQAQATAELDWAVSQGIDAWRRRETEWMALRQ